MREQRNLERFDLRIPAKIEVLGRPPAGGNGRTDLVTRNICSGGAFFQTPSPLPEGTRVQMVLFLGLHRPGIPEYTRPHIKVNGRVLRSGPTGMAIGFNEHYRILPGTNS